MIVTIKIIHLRLLQNIMICKYFGDILTIQITTKGIQLQVSFIRITKKIAEKYHILNVKTKMIVFA